MSDKTVLIIGDESSLPHQRPPLSKAYLKGELEEARLYFKNTATTNTGKVIEFDHLVFATCSRNRQLPMDGAELGNVFGLRDLADVDALRPHVGKPIMTLTRLSTGLK